MKKIPILSNLFSRSRSNAGSLETDAAPVDDDLPENRSVQINSTNNQSINSADFNAALQLQNQMAESSDLSIARSNHTQVVSESVNNINSLSPTTITNNQMAVQNTQGQLVMQFSNVNGLQFGSNYTFNSTGKQLGNTLSSPENVTSNTGRPRRTRTIEAMMKCSEELDHRMIDCISTHLGEGWKNVFRDLNFTDGQIEQSIIDNQVQGGVKEVIYQLLLGWTNNSEDGEATLGVITQILWKSNHRECVQKMKEVWKLTNAQRTN